MFRAGDLSPRVLTRQKVVTEILLVFRVRGAVKRMVS